MSLMYEAFKARGANGSSAWCLALIIPSNILFCTARAVYDFSRDSPRGEFLDLVKAGTKDKVIATMSAKKGYGYPVTRALAAHLEFLMCWMFPY